MKIGVTLPVSGPLATAKDLALLARHAEELGFSSVWLSGDHIVVPASSDSIYPYSSDGKMTWNPSTPWLDPFVALAYVASVTKRATIGTSVLILPLRPTLLVAKMAASIDCLSDGRVVLGVGAGWLREEFKIVGESFDDRGPRMTEAISLLRRCWSDGPTELDPHARVLPPFGFYPKPVQGEHLPILCGGHSDVALRRVAEIADGWHPTRLEPQVFRERLRRLVTLVHEAGRRIADLQVVPRIPDRAHLSSVVPQYEALGIDELVIGLDYAQSSPAHAIARLRELASVLHVHI